MTSLMNIYVHLIYEVIADGLGYDIDDYNLTDPMYCVQQACWDMISSL